MDAMQQATEQAKVQALNALVQEMRELKQELQAIRASVANIAGKR